MPKLEVESSAQAPEDKIGTNASRFEETFIGWGIAFGFIIGLTYALSHWERYRPVGAILGMLIFGTLAGWVYHLAFTPAEMRKAAYKAPAASSVEISDSN